MSLCRIGRTPIEKPFPRTDEGLRRQDGKKCFMNETPTVLKKGHHTGRGGNSTTAKFPLFLYPHYAPTACRSVSSISPSKKWMYRL